MTESAPTRLQHIVLMKYPTELTPAEDAELRGIVLSLPGDIDELLACRFGSAMDLSRTQGYQYLLLTEFRDTDALAAYVAHPAHQVLVRWLDARACQRLAFDYHLDESTDAFA
jgi:stress responsive alpha/beta barrel protein